MSKISVVWRLVCFSNKISAPAVLVFSTAFILSTILFSNNLYSNEPEHGIPEVIKLLDVPLRDTAICRDSEGTWYMTGTVEPFWAYNKGICVWKSTDLKKWTSLGMVWEYGDCPWHERFRKAGKPLWAPEIHYIKDTFWLTYSLPMIEKDGTVTSGSGLLKSKTGKAEGPYEEVSPDAPLGDEVDASLFQDDDGTVYYLWHCGKIAKMNEDMTAFAEVPKLLETTEEDSDPAHHSGLCGGIFKKTKSHNHVGFEGAFLFKHDGMYYLSCSEVFHGRYSCTIARSKNIYGPYSKRYEALPHAGHNMFFKDDKGEWCSSFFGSGKTPIWTERPGYFPISIDKDGTVKPKNVVSAKKDE